MKNRDRRYRKKIFWCTCWFIRSVLSYERWNQNTNLVRCYRKKVLWCTCIYDHSLCSYQECGKRKISLVAIGKTFFRFTQDILIYIGIAIKYWFNTRHVIVCPTTTFDSCCSLSKLFWYFRMKTETTWKLGLEKSRMFNHKEYLSVHVSLRQVRFY